LNIEVEERSNMELWDSWFKTDPSITKKVNKGGGRTITSPDAYAQIRLMTQKFGPMGKWGFKNVKTYTSGDLMFFEAIFFYPEGEFAVCNTASMYIGRGEKRRIDDEVGKKILTDQMTKCFSYLGMSADIFMGMFDSNRYVEERTKEVAEDKEKQAGPIRDNAIAVLAIKLEDSSIDEEQHKLMKNRLLHMNDIGELTRALEIIKGFGHAKDSSAG
jgi:hypothetical protein